MSEFRGISGEGLSKPAGALNPGPAPMMQWVKIESLRVDPSYQRDIMKVGKRTIQRIADEFDWSKFSCVVVAPIEGGLFAIVDGQHRATAALVCGFETVPCYIVQADRSQQAAAFSAINANVTKITPMQLHAARVTSGDEAANELERICAAADVKIMRYPKCTHDMKVGETMAAAALVKLAATVPADTLIRALQCITQVGDGNPGLLGPGVIRAYVDVLTWHPEWVDRASDLFDAIEDFDLLAALDRRKHLAVSVQLNHLLEEKLGAEKVAA